MSDEVIGVRRGMFGINGSGDTSGYGRLVREVALPGSTPRPYGGYFDDVVDRLAEVLEACAVQPQSTSDIVPVLFKRKLDLHQLTFAMGEALAHLHALYFEGKLTRAQDADGIVRFKAA